MQTRTVTPEAVVVLVVVVVSAPPLRPVFCFSVCVPGARVGGAAVAAGPGVEPLRTPFQMQEQHSDAGAALDLLHAAAHAAAAHEQQLARCRSSS